MLVGCASALSKSVAIFMILSHEYLS